MTIHIAFSSDRNFLTCTSVTIASILHFHPSDINFYLLHEKLTEKDLLPLAETISRLGKNCRLLPVNVGKANWDGFPTNRNLPLATYFRLNLPALLPNVDKVIYMDGDILVTDDIQKVWDIDLHEYSVAAMSVKNIVNAFPELIGHYVFNAGFLLLNLQRIRESNGTTRLQETAKLYKDKLQLFDQDILNLTFKDETLRLPVRWNLTSGALGRGDDNYRTIPEEELVEAIQNPAVIHFTTSCKPWKFRVKIKHPFSPLYPFFAKLAGAPLAFRCSMFFKYTLKLNQRLHFSQWTLEHLSEIKKTIKRIRRS